MDPELDAEINAFILNIENKYATSTPKSYVDEQLFHLSKEFDSLGLPILDLEQSPNALLEQIASSSQLLVQLHRNSLSNIQDIGANSIYKDAKNVELQKCITALKAKLQVQDKQNKELEAKISRLCRDSDDFKRTISNHINETDKLKRYFKSKQNELNHEINALKNDNQRLKEMCGQDIDKYYSKDDKFLKIITKYKQNEEIYKGVIKQMDEKNAELLNELINLKSD